MRATSTFVTGNWLFAAMLVMAAGAHGSSGLLTDNCNVQAIQGFVPKETTVSFAAPVVGGECRVYGHVTTNDPTPNRVHFVLSLPQNFNGRFLFLGVGGAAGVLPQIPMDLSRQGYALAGTDAGTGARTGSDFSFMSDPAKHTDFLWRGVQVTATATQSITRSYYQREQVYRYISGCSGGGQMGLGNSRRFGDENFDGFVVGATPWQATLYMPNIYRIASHLQNNPAGWIPPELIASANEAIIAAYDDSDGAVDGIIWDERNITEFDVSILEALGFSPEQIETFELIRKPSEYPAPGLRGDGVHPGFPVTSLPAWSGFLLGMTPPPWPGSDDVSPAELTGKAPFIHIMADTRTRATYGSLDYWLIEDPKRLVEVATRGGVDVPFDDPMDFSALHDSDAKMIIWHGANDEAMSYLESVAGTEAIWERFPGSRDWLAYYSIPGLLHCRGGSGPTDSALVSALVEQIAQWVEKGESPSELVVGRYSQEQGLEREFLLCPEPLRAHLRAPGLDYRESDSWQCLDPADRL